MRIAYELGSTWIWVMDDDVEVMRRRSRPHGRVGAAVQVDPGAALRLRRQRVLLAVPDLRAPRHPDPFAPSGFDASGYKEMNSAASRACSSTATSSADRPARPAVLHLLGRPDLRLARVARDDVGHRERVRPAPHREIKQWDMGIRHMNASSDAYRYYIMRNRAIIKRYYRALGVYNPVAFGLGTALTFGKEIIRLLFVERKISGTSHLFRGLRDGRKIARDRDWRPMPPLVDAAV
jgi:hypothetical protein